MDKIHGYMWYRSIRRPVARPAIEHWCRIPTEVELAHGEFRYRDPIVKTTGLWPFAVIGETMDTDGRGHCTRTGRKGYTTRNTHGSTPADWTPRVQCTAGPEITVALDQGGSWHRSPQHTCSACTWHSCKATSTRDEIASIPL